MFRVTSISVILFVTTLLNIFTTFASLQRRKTSSGWYFALGMLGVTFWTMAACLDYAAITIPDKILFAKFETIGYNSGLAFFAMFGLSYAGYDNWLEKPWLKGLLILVPLSNIMLAWTNDLTGWLWSGYRLNGSGFNTLIFEHGSGFLWTLISAYSLVLVIFTSLWQAARSSSDLTRRQARTLALALLISVASNLVYLLIDEASDGIDWTSVTFSISGLIFLFALYGTRLLDLAPIARNTMIEQMSDGILVLDDNDRLVDTNRQANEIFKITKYDLGRPIQEILPDWPEILELVLPRSTNKSTQLIIRHADGSVVFDTHLTLLEGKPGRTLGKLIALRNITDHYQTERALAERAKEFKCIYDLAILVETPRISFDEILNGRVSLISRAMQYPSLACARIVLQDCIYSTENFRETEQPITQDLTVGEEKVGAVQVGYLEQTGISGTLSFSEEEKSLLLILAERLGKVILRNRLEKAAKASTLERLAVQAWASIVCVPGHSCLAGP
jgi:PAS domain S-box-containing protein